MIEAHTKKLIDETIAQSIFSRKLHKSQLKNQLVQTLLRRGHTRKRAQQLVKENWGK